MSHIVGGDETGRVYAAEVFEQKEPPSASARVWRAKSADVKIRRICTPCNNGWLAELERRVSDLLTPTILGTSEVTFTPEEQTLVARWAVKTVTLMRFARQQPYAPPTREELEWIMKQDEPPPQSGVWLAAYGGDAHFYMSLSRAHLEPPEDLGVPPLDAELTTFSAMRLIVVVLQFPDSEQDVIVGTSNSLKDFIVKLWPLPGFNVRWPCRMGVDDDGLIKLGDALTNGLIQVFLKVGRLPLRAVD